MRMAGLLARAAAALGGGVLAMAAIQPAQAQEASCDKAAWARDSTGAHLWIEICDPYKVRAGGGNLSPGDTITLHEAHWGQIIGEATVAPGEDSATTEYWSGRVAYGERPFSHVAVADIGGAHPLRVSETDRSR